MNDDQKSLICTFDWSQQLCSYNWNWRIFWESPAGLNPPEYYYEWIARGFGWTVATSLSAWVLAFVLGVLIGVGRTTPIRPLQWLGTAYVEIFRNTPLAVQLFIWFFVLPELLPTRLGLWMKQDMPFPEFSIGVLGLALFTGARISEVVRTGILTLPEGQRAAALALGFTLSQSYRHVILPTALRAMLPPLTSELMTVFKNSAVALTIGLTELTFQTRHITGDYAPGNPIEIMLLASVLYIVTAWIAHAVMALIERSTRIPGFLGTPP